MRSWLWRRNRWVVHHTRTCMWEAEMGKEKEKDWKRILRGSFKDLKKVLHCRTNLPLAGQGKAHGGQKCLRASQA